MRMEVGSIQVGMIGDTNIRGGDSGCVCVRRRVTKTAKQQSSKIAAVTDNRTREGMRGSTHEHFTASGSPVAEGGT